MTGEQLRRLAIGDEDIVYGVLGVPARQCATTLVTGCRSKPAAATRIYIIELIISSGSAILLPMRHISAEDRGATPGT